MLKNFLVVALRNLRRQALYSFINIAGLAVGLACTLVIFLFVVAEWHYDRHFPNAERIYRISMEFYNMGEFANAPELLKDYLPKEFEGIDKYTRFQKEGEALVYADDALFRETVYHVDSAFFQVFEYSFQEGSNSTALLHPRSIVLTASMAQKLFRTTDVMGRTVELGTKREPYIIRGIVEDPNPNTHLKSAVWVSLDPSTIHRQYWTSAAVHTYVVLKPHVSREDLEDALDRVIANHVHPQSYASGRSLEAYVADPNSVRFFVRPLTDIYLKSKAHMELTPGGNETNLLIFSTVAAFILLLAAVNFINLATARAARRAKEVGVRKALGTSRARLVFQFLTESVLTTLLAMIVALGLAELFSFLFFWITDQQLSTRLWASGESVLAVVAFSILIGLLAGVYPAFYLTSFRPINVLKGNLQAGRSSSFRNALVILQFTVSISLIICAAVILRQLRFVSSKDLGFSESNVVTIKEIHKLKHTAIPLREEILKWQGVRNASLHSGEPGSKAILAFQTYQTDVMDHSLTISTFFTDDNYLETMGMRLLSGRNFDRNRASDSAAVILNEAAVMALGLPENPVGAVLNKTTTVIGVVSDFHWESLRNTIAPLALSMTSGRHLDGGYAHLAVKLEANAVKPFISAMEARWKEMLPGEPFEYYFLDENFGALLKKEEVLAKAIIVFTLVAVMISCLGLFGLSAYTTEQRTKEISIRKVLGASVPAIVMLLNKQFTRLVFLAIMIALPISYYACHEWLSGFAYHTDLPAWLFLGGAASGLLLAYGTVAYHSVKASRVNPAETLKTE